MIAKDQVTLAITNAVAAFNAQRPKTSQLRASASDVLFGKDGQLDSLALVEFILTVEEHLNKQLGTSPALTSVRALSQANSPFRTVETLSEFTTQLMNESPS